MGRALLGAHTRPLLAFAGAPARLRALGARGGRARAHGIARHAPRPGTLGQALELVGRLVDRLQVALVLELPALRRDIRVPALGHSAARELHIALVERGLELQQEQMLLYVKDACGHDWSTLATKATAYPACQCLLSTSLRCTACRSCIRPTRRC